MDCHFQVIGTNRSKEGRHDFCNWLKTYLCQNTGWTWLASARLRTAQVPTRPSADETFFLGSMCASFHWPLLFRQFNVDSSVSDSFVSNVHYDSFHISDLPFHSEGLESRVGSHTALQSYEAAIGNNTGWVCANSSGCLSVCLLNSQLFRGVTPPWQKHKWTESPVTL